MKVIHTDGPSYSSIIVSDRRKGRALVSVADEANVVAIALDASQVNRLIDILQDVLRNSYDPAFDDAFDETYRA